jgi:hypothetical protein
LLLWLFNKGRQVVQDIKGISVLPNGLPTGFRIDSANNTRILFDLPIRINNTTEIPLVFNRFQGNATIGNNINTSFNLDTGGRSAPAGGFATYTLPISISIASLGLQAYEIITKGWSSFAKDIKVTGTLYLAAGITIPVNIQYSWQSQGGQQNANIGRGLHNADRYSSRVRPNTIHPFYQLKAWA